VIDSRPEWIRRFLADVHYLHYGIGLFILTLIVTSAISYLTEPIAPEKLHRLTFWTKQSTEVREPIDSQQMEINLQAQRSHEAPNNISGPAEDSYFRKLFNCICGLGNSSDETNGKEEGGSPQMTPEEEAIIAAKFLDEDKFWRR